MIQRILNFLFGKTLYVTLRGGVYSRVKGVRRQALATEQVCSLDPDSPDKLLMEDRKRVQFFGLFGKYKGGFWQDEVVKIGPEFPTKEESL